MSTVKLSVNDLVEFCARKGDLNSGSQGPSAIEGIRGHQHIQSNRDKTWVKELNLRHIYEIEGVTIQLQGRADLVSLLITPIVEELKTSYIGLDNIEPDRIDLYWQQLKVYGALISAMQSEQGTPIANLELRLTIVLLPEKKQQTSSQIFNSEELESLVFGYLVIYARWIKGVMMHRNARNQSTVALNYPFPTYRRGQYDLARYIFRAIQVGRPLLVEAPTGLGKTMAAIFPAIKSFANNNIQRIIYLTHKSISQQEPCKAFHQLKSKGAKLKQLTLCAKEKLCFCSGDSDYQPCQYKLGFYDKLPMALAAAFKLNQIGETEWREIGEQYQICPFSLSLHLTPWFDIVIADVNYFYDPLIMVG